MEAIKGPRLPILNMSSSQFYWGMKSAIGEISDPQDVHMDWKKVKPLGAPNMILG